jgi:sigma-B regulation protein RsbU (phosphoserine phosphatase)
VCLEYARIVVGSEKHLILEGSGRDRPSALAVPIPIGNNAIGAMVLLATPDRGMFTSGDRISLSALAGYLGVALNSARLLAEAREAEALRHEIAFAQQIQQSLLPERLPEFRNLEVAARCIASAQVGGDLYGFHKLDADQWAFIVADVAGHGLGAAFIMASLRSTLRSEAKPGNGPAHILQNSNNLLADDTRGNDVYATVFAAVYSEHQNLLRYSNAGHPPALLWKAASRECCELHEGGMALGLFRDETYEEKSVSLRTGDILVMYTDGVVETKNAKGELYGDRRFRQAIASHAESSPAVLVDAVLRSVEDFRGRARQNDDVTILIFKSR